MAASEDGGDLEKACNETPGFPGRGRGGGGEWDEEDEEKEKGMLYVAACLPLCFNMCEGGFNALMKIKSS